MSRAALREAQQRLAATIQRADEAAEVVRRATEMLQSAERAAVAVANVDHAITTHRAMEMRAGGKLGSLPAHLVEAKRLCDEAAATVASSRAALVSLQQEQADADTAETEAQADVTEAAVAVVATEALLLATRLKGMRQVQEETQRELVDLTQLWVPLRRPRPDGLGNELTVAPITLPAAVVDALNPPPQQIRKVGDNAKWHAYLFALQTDADAKPGS